MTKPDYLYILETAINEWRRYGDIGSSVLVREPYDFRKHLPFMNERDMMMLTETAIRVTFDTDGVKFQR
jgi:hypothetical protein